MTQPFEFFSGPWQYQIKPDFGKLRKEGGFVGMSTGTKSAHKLLLVLANQSADESPAYKVNWDNVQDITNTIYIKKYLAQEHTEDFKEKIKAYFSKVKEWTLPKEEKEKNNLTGQLKHLDPFDFFLDQNNDALAVLKGDRTEIYPVKSSAFKRILTAKAIQEGVVLSNDKINILRNAAEAMALGKPKKELWVRTAKNKDDSDAFYYDLCNDAWQVAKINADGVQILDKSPVLFKRYPAMRPAEIDLTGSRQDFDQYLSFFNLRHEDEKLVLFEAYLTTAFIPGWPHPIINFHGSHGSAKSTAHRLVRSLIDPSSTLTSGLPRDRREIEQQLSHNYLSFYDNIDRLEPWQSDLACRACTGESINRRELYSDDEDRIYNYQRCVGFNGINLPSNAPDFLDRSLVFELERITPQSRKTEEDVWAAVEPILPKVRGYLLNTVSKAISIKRDMRWGELARMADFSQYGEACARALGHAPDMFRDAYKEAQIEMNDTVLSDDPLAQAILALMEDDKPENQRIPEWQGTPQRLLDKLNEVQVERIQRDKEAWPQNVRALGKQINVIKPNLAAKGYFISVSRSHGTRKIEIKQKTNAGLGSYL